MHLPKVARIVLSLFVIVLAAFGGAIGGLHVNYVQRPPVHRLEIVGTGGTLRWDNADGTLHAIRMPDPFGTWSTQPGAAVEQQYALPDGFERNQLFAAQMRHFLEVASGESEPVCTLNDGIRALELAMAAYRSQSSGSVAR
jgi:predicted dehydrogenase